MGLAAPGPAGALSNTGRQAHRKQPGGSVDRSRAREAQRAPQRSAQLPLRMVHQLNDSPRRGKFRHASAADRRQDMEGRRGNRRTGRLDVMPRGCDCRCAKPGRFWSDCRHYMTGSGPPLVKAMEEGEQLWKILPARSSWPRWCACAQRWRSAPSATPRCAIAWRPRQPTMPSGIGTWTAIMCSGTTRWSRPTAIRWPASSAPATGGWRTSTRTTAAASTLRFMPYSMAARLPGTTNIASAVWMAPMRRFSIEAM